MNRETLLMATFKLNLPNDFGSEADDALAMAQAYGEDAADFAGDSDAANRMYEPITEAASAAGLQYVEESTYGATWEGTDEQFAACVAALPAWAKRYASKIETEPQTLAQWMAARGANTSDVHFENLSEPVEYESDLGNGERVAITETTYVIDYPAGHYSGGREYLEQDFPEVFAHWMAA